MPKKPLNPANFEQFDTPVPRAQRGSSLFHPLQETSQINEPSGTDIIGEYALSQILPDPYQGRGGVLPTDLSLAVSNGDISPEDALETWLKNLDQKSIYWARFEALRELADSIAVQGLINPIHIYHPPHDLKGYRIESGERRYWAHWLLQRDQPGKYTHIRAIVEEGYSLDRQIDENEDVLGLTPVGQARNIARMYLTLLEIYPPFQQRVTPELLANYYRQAALPVTDLIGQKYLPDGFWDRFISLTRMSRQSLDERLHIFELPPKTLEIADSGEVNFHQLKVILEAGDEQVRNDLIAVAARTKISAKSLRRLVDLSLNNLERYQDELDEYLKKGHTSRKQSAPLEVHSRRLIQAMSGFRKASAGDYRIIAQRIQQENPEGVQQLAEDLEQLSWALRALPRR